MLRRVISIVVAIGLLFNQGGGIYAAGELNLSSYLSQLHTTLVKPDIFRPVHLRYFSYDSLNNSYKILLDKGDYERSPGHQVTTSPGHQVTPDASVGAGTSPEKEDSVLKETAQELMRYFLIGVTLPNDTFWVNLRPDAPENIIDPELEMTDIGKVFLEADLQLKKDTASLTSPQTPEGKAYWDKLYKKAGELFGSENITIPTLTRPWIVPNEIIVRETDDSAYVYKATLKVLLEEDYLKESLQSPVASHQYNFNDKRLKELNEYSTQLIRESIIPKLTREVNSSQRYAKLRQVYYSLILSRWFKARFGEPPVNGSVSEPVNPLTGTPDYSKLIDSRNLTNLTSKENWDKTTYFNQYKNSFNKGEYTIKDSVYTPYGHSVRNYTSGGLTLEGIENIFTSTHRAVGNSSPLTGGGYRGVNPEVTQWLVKRDNVAAFDSNLQIIDPHITTEESLALAASPLTMDEIKVEIRNLGVRYAWDIKEREEAGEIISCNYLSNLIQQTIILPRINDDDKAKWEKIRVWLLRMARYESEINRFVAQLERKNYLDEEDKRELKGYFYNNDFVSAANKLSSIAQNTLHDVELGFRFIRLSEEIRAFVLKGTAADGTKSALQELEGVDVKNKALGRKPSALPLGIRDNFLVVANTISLPEGSRTGRTNIGNASLLDGIIANHPEWRKEIEERIENALGNIFNNPEYKTEAKRDEKWRKTLEAEGVNLEGIESLSLKSNTYVGLNAISLAAKARYVANTITNLQLKKTVIFAKNHPIKRTILFLGEVSWQREQGKTNEILEKDIAEILEGITAEDAGAIGLRIAYEPRELPKEKVREREQIEKEHSVIKNALKKALHIDLDVYFVGGLTAQNADEILGLSSVDGAILGKSAKTVVALTPFVEAALRQGAKKNKILTIGMNWKAENKETGLEPLGSFMEFFKDARFDWPKVGIVIGTPETRKVKEGMLKVIRYYWEQSQVSSPLKAYSASPLTWRTLSVPIHKRPYKFHYASAENAMNFVLTTLERPVELYTFDNREVTVAYLSGEKSDRIRIALGAGDRVVGVLVLEKKARIITNVNGKTLDINKALIIAGMSELLEAAKDKEPVIINSEYTSKNNDVLNWLNELLGKKRLEKKGELIRVEYVQAEAIVKNWQKKTGVSEILSAPYLSVAPPLLKCQKDVIIDVLGAYGEKAGFIMVDALKQVITEKLADNARYAENKAIISLVDGLTSVDGRNTRGDFLASWVKEMKSEEIEKDVQMQERDEFLLKVMKEYFSVMALKVELELDEKVEQELTQNNDRLEHFFEKIKEGNYFRPEEEEWLKEHISKEALSFKVDFLREAIRITRIFLGRDTGYELPREKYTIISFSLGFASIAASAFAESSSALSLDTETSFRGEKRGGLDFRDTIMNDATTLERRGSFAGLNLDLPVLRDAELIDLDNEFSQIQATMKAGIIPNGLRILEFIAACYQRDELQGRLQDIIITLSDACRLEELAGKESSPELRRALLAPDMLYN
ncbi:MAG: hypothetical protein A2Y01_04770 [Omnitrophica WOR_2 bacterium GWC2_44_8]|nr:MAG: hypothetical protein A2Y01_04770 [Omnitrophica WOR_2 bacterium GWC2_44_8]